MDAQWTPNGLPMDSQWTHCGNLFFARNRASACQKNRAGISRERPQPFLLVKNRCPLGVHWESIGSPLGVHWASIAGCPPTTGALEGPKGESTELPKAANILCDIHWHTRWLLWAPREAPPVTLNFSRAGPKMGGSTVGGPLQWLYWNYLAKGK